MLIRHILSFFWFIVLTACAITSTSCKKFTEVPPPQNDITAQQAFSNSVNATKTIKGIYISIMDTKWSLLNGGMSLFEGLSADELLRTQPSTAEDPFTNNTLNSQNYVVSGFYGSAFNWIYQANAIIENAPLSRGIDDSTKRQLIGEAKFVRALTYFCLINLYGNIPLILSPDFQVTATQAQTPKEIIYSSVKMDLLDAQQLLSPHYVGDAEGIQTRTRPNRATATALLARVYCYLKDWTSAEEAATTLIEDPSYTLSTDLDKTFSTASPEIIWQLQPVHENTNSAEGSFFIPRPGARPVYCLTQWLLNSFEPGDQRFTHWLSTNDHQLFYPFKYRQASNKPAGLECDVILRLAEQYLIRAEARIMQNNATGAAADLNIVRQRAGLNKIDASADIIPAIWHERQVELFAECGHRWLDLKRTGLIDTVLGKEKVRWEPFKALYPIPFSQLESNPNLIQNPGY